jgi:DNA-binding NtrC family response regulator
MENFSSSGAARIAVLTTEESIKLAAQETLAPDFHTTLLDAVEGLLGLQNEVPLEGIIIDLDLDRPDGADPMIEVVSQLRAHDEDIVLIGITRPLGKAVRHKFLARGLARCFEIPVDFDEVNNFLHGALDQRRRDIEARNIREEALSRYSFGELIGGSEAMHLVYEAISRVARGNTTVMIRGESGTGKELVARALVANSTRSDEAFVSVNCAALPEALIESELFGHEKGAFTGAHESRAGHIELADGGTVFLDEIGTLGLALQSKLLRVLELRVRSTSASSRPPTKIWSKQFMRASFARIFTTGSTWCLFTCRRSASAKATSLCSWITSCAFIAPRTACPRSQSIPTHSKS